MPLATYLSQVSIVRFLINLRFTFRTEAPETYDSCNVHINLESFLRVPDLVLDLHQRRVFRVSLQNSILGN
jgi:hypothetical protein